jgi:hypothetical protein
VSFGAALVAVAVGWVAVVYGGEVPVCVVVAWLYVVDGVGAGVAAQVAQVVVAVEDARHGVAGPVWW